MQHAIKWSHVMHVHINTLTRGDRRVYTANPCKVIVIIMAFTVGPSRSLREQVAALEVVELWRRLTRYFYLMHARHGILVGGPSMQCCFERTAYGDCDRFLHPTVFCIMFPYVDDVKTRNDWYALKSEWDRTPYPTTTTPSQTCGAVLVYPFFYAFLLTKIGVYAVMLAITLPIVVAVYCVAIVGKSCLIGLIDCLTIFAKWLGRLAWTVLKSCALCLCEAVCRVRLTTDRTAPDVSPGVPRSESSMEDLVDAPNPDPPQIVVIENS